MLHAFLLRNGHFSPRRYRHYSISENVLQRNRDFIFSIFGFFSLLFFQNFHLRFFEEQKRPSGPPERALSSPRNLFFLPPAIAEASRSVPAFFRTPSERFSLPEGMLFPRVRSSFPRRPSLLRPFSPFLSPPFSHALRLCSSFLENCPFSSPLFFPRVLIPLASIFTLFKTLFPSLFPPCASFMPFLPLRLFPFHFFFRFLLHFFFRFLPDFPRFFYSSQPCPILTAFTL